MGLSRLDFQPSVLLRGVEVVGISVQALGGIKPYIYIYTYICIYGCGSKAHVVAGHPCYKPLSRLAVSKPVSNPLHIALRYRFVFLGICRGGVCRRTTLSVTNLCCEMAAQACYTPNVLDSLPYVYMYIMANKKLKLFAIATGKGIAQTSKVHAQDPEGVGALSCRPGHLKSSIIRLACEH